jgi:hypothetical protein
MDQSLKDHLPDKTLTGVFQERESAEKAYSLLNSLGYSEDEITVLMSDEARVRYFPAPGMKGEVVGNTITEGPGLGGVVGAGAGAAVGAILGAAAAIVLPGVGLVIAGPLAISLAGATLGGLSGGLLGSLLGIGIPEDQAKTYEEKINQGNILIAVNPRSQTEAEKIIQEWQSIGGEVMVQ